MTNVNKLKEENRNLKRALEEREKELKSLKDELQRGKHYEY